MTSQGGILWLRVWLSLIDRLHVVRIIEFALPGSVSTHCHGVVDCTLRNFLFPDLRSIEPCARDLWTGSIPVSLYAQSAWSLPTVAAGSTLETQIHQHMLGR